MNLRHLLLYPYERYFAGVIVVLSGLSLVGISIRRYLVVTMTSADPVTDAQVWLNVGKTVVNGADLYVSVPDNKPPGWQFIVIASAGTPWPHLMLLLVGGVSGAILVYLTYRLASGHAAAIPAAIGSALIAFGIIILTRGFVTNKTLAMALLLLGLTYPRQRLAGVAYGLSFLVAQQVLLAVPVIVWWVENQSDRNTVLSVASVGFLTIALLYLLVGILWGGDALVASIEQTVLLAESYATESSQFQTGGSLLTSFYENYPNLIHQSGRVSPLLLFALLGTGRIANNQTKTPPTVWLALGLSAILSLALVMRVYRHYWILPIPGFCLLAAYAFDWGFEVLIGHGQ